MESPKEQIEHYAGIASQIGEYLGDPRHPSRDWRVVVGVAFVLVLLLIAFAGYLFVKISAGEIFIVDSETNESAQPINRVLLQDALAGFRDKAETFTEVQDGIEPIVDPSL